MYFIALNEKEVMTLKEGKEGHVGVKREESERGNDVIIVISKNKRKKNFFLRQAFSAQP